MQHVFMLLFDTEKVGSDDYLCTRLGADRRSGSDPRKYAEYVNRALPLTRTIYLRSRREIEAGDTRVT
jgi:hypothetical protein